MRINKKSINNIYEYLKYKKINKNMEDEMSEYEIILEEAYSKKLGMGPTAKKIFQEINNKPEAILNFKNIEFMSRSFAQEYVFQKHNNNTKITEVNMSESIKQLLDIVSEDFEKTCLR